MATELAKDITLQTHARVKINPDKLCNVEVSRAFRQKIHSALQYQSHVDCHKSWEQFKGVMQQAQRELLADHEAPQKGWVTEQTKAVLAEEREAWQHLVQMRINEKKNGFEVNKDSWSEVKLALNRGVLIPHCCLICS